MPGITVFISHASADRAQTKELLAALRAAAPADELSPRVDFELLADYESLRLGEEWPRQLNEWMARSHAGVILLTEAAVRSAWVLKEATILTWRKSVDPGFVLIPLRAPEVTDELLRKEKFDPLMLPLLQSWSERDMGNIAATIREQLRACDTRSTPFDRLIGRLADILVGVGENTLRDVAVRLHAPTPHWQPGADPRRHMAEAMARSLLCQDLGGYTEGGLNRLLGELAITTDKETLRRLLAFLAPHWVDCHAAGQLAAVATATARRAAALNGEFLVDYTAKMYAMRAHPLDASMHLVIGTAGGSSGDDLEHYTREICQHFWEMPRFAKWSPSVRGQRIIDHLRERSMHRYVVLPPPVPDGDCVRALVERFPKLTFLLGTGPELERVSGVEAEWLSPPLDVKREAMAFSDHGDASDLIESRPD